MNRLAIAAAAALVLSSPCHSARKKQIREEPHTVQAKTIFKSSFVEPLEWTDYTANTIYSLPGFKPSSDPGTDEYGGWDVEEKLKPGRFFRVARINGRWFLITPEGNPFIAKGIAKFSFGSTSREIEARKARFGPNVSDWLRAETDFLIQTGFNSVGAWSQTKWIVKADRKIPYTVIYQPTSRYNRMLKESGTEALAYSKAGWEGFPNDFVMVFDERLYGYIEEDLRDAVVYRDDPYCIGYFIDNELPWKDYALDRCLEAWPSDHINHIKAQEWLDARKERKGCTLKDANDEDRKEFIAYCHEIYLKRVTAILRKYDPNHLYLGCRFNHWRFELANDRLLEMAGRYMDVISLNHYRFWEPDPKNFDHWSEVAGAPCLVTEFYTKGLDFDEYYSDHNSLLTNKSGAGWVVHTQEERGLFYHNFIINLMKSKGCVGWNWFLYMDSDPTGKGGDRSSNRGIVTYEFERYTPLVERMKQMNDNVYRLIGFHDRNN